MRPIRRALALLLTAALLGGMVPAAAAQEPEPTVHLQEDFSDSARYPDGAAPAGAPASAAGIDAAWVSDGDVQAATEAEGRYVRVTGAPDAARLTLDFSKTPLSGLVEITFTVRLVSRSNNSPCLMDVLDTNGTKLFSMNSNRNDNIQAKDEATGWKPVLQGSQVLGQFHTYVLSLNTVEGTFSLSADGQPVLAGCKIRNNGGTGQVGSLAVYGNGSSDSGVIDVRAIQIASTPLEEADDSFLSISAPNSTLMESPTRIYGTAPANAEEVTLVVEKAKLDSLVEYRKWEEQAAFAALGDALEYDYDTADAGKFDPSLLRAGTGLYLNAGATGFVQADAPVEITVPAADEKWSLDVSGAGFERGARYLITVKADDQLAVGSFTVTDQVAVLKDEAMAGIFTGPDAYVEQVAARIRLPEIPDRTFVVTGPAYGAKGDGTTDDKPAFDAAIAAVKAAGGGKVVVPAGTYLLNGPIWMESNMELHLEEGAVIRFQFDPASYPNVLVRFEGVRCFNYSPLIYAYGKENLAITGQGTIDGQTSTGWAGWKSEQEPQKAVLRAMGQEGAPLEERVFGYDYPLDGGGRLRPDGIEFYECSNILIEGVTIQGSPFWSTHYVKSDNITFRNVTVKAGTTNDDGFDPDSCQNVLVENCTFNTADDNIAIKAGRDNDAWEDEVTTDVVIRNNTFENTNANTICMGSEMSGGIYNVFSYDCDVDYVRDSALFLKADTDRGGEIAQIYFKDITVKTADQRNQGGLIFFQLDYKGYSDGPYPSTLREVYFDNITGRTANNGIRFSGLDRQYISNVYFNDVVIDEVTKTPINTKYTENIHATNVWLNGTCMDTSDPAYRPIPAGQFGLRDDVLAHVWVGDASLRVFDPEQTTYLYDLSGDALPEVRAVTQTKAGEVAIVNATPEHPVATLSAGGTVYTIYFIPKGSSLVTFETNGGSALEPVLVQNGGTLSAPDAPTRAGYYFDGWFADPACETPYDFSAPVAGGLTLYAKWLMVTSGRNRYDIALSGTEHGSLLASSSSAAAGTAVTLTARAEAGYVLHALTATDAQGNALKLTGKGGGKYTFQMPRSKVTVTAAFRPEETEETPGGLPFRDVAEGAWYYDAAAYAVDKGFMAGVTSDTFAPDAQLTRAQLSQMLYALEGAPEPGDNLGYPFADVQPGAWYVDAVYWARSSGLVAGYDGERFGPDDPLTREQLAAILHAYAKYKGADVSGRADLSAYPDIANLSPWAQASMAWAVDAGLVGGMDGGSLAPTGTATRAQVAQILKNLLEKAL